MRRRLVNADDVGVTGVSEPSAAEAPADLAEGETAVPDVRRRARETGQEAEALKAQAEHQVRRARRNVAAALKGRRARVLVVDDSPAFLHAASSIVSAAASLRLVGVAASGERAIELLAELKPDLVLLDINMPGMDGVETAGIIQAERPEAVVVLVSAEPTGFEAAGQAAGAVAVLDKRGLRPRKLEALWSQHRPEL